MGSSRTLRQRSRAGLGVERDDEVLALVVPGYDQRVAVRGPGRRPRRSRCASASRRGASPRARLPFQVESVEPARAEERVDPLAVGERRGRGEAAVPRALPSCGTSSCSTLRQRSLPSLRSRASTTNSRAVGIFSAGTAVETSTMSPAHDRAAETEPGDLDLPAHVLGLRPLERRVGGRALAGAQRAAPFGQSAAAAGGARRARASAGRRPGPASDAVMKPPSWEAFRPFYRNRDAGKRAEARLGLKAMFTPFCEGLIAG